MHCWVEVGGGLGDRGHTQHPGRTTTAKVWVCCHDNHVCVCVTLQVAAIVASIAAVVAVLAIVTTIAAVIILVLLFMLFLLMFLLLFLGNVSGVDAVSVSVFDAVSVCAFNAISVSAVHEPLLALF